MTRHMFAVAFLAATLLSATAAQAAPAAKVVPDRGKVTATAGGNRASARPAAEVDANAGAAPAFISLKAKSLIGAVGGGSHTDRDV